MADTGTSVDISRSIYSGRTLGMGGAHVGLSDDGDGLFTNPSGLARIEFPQMMGLSRKIMLDETSYTLYSFAAPTNWGTFGIGYCDARTGGSYPTMRDPGTNRVVINPSLEAINYESNVMLFTYARKLPWRSILLGGNLKIFNQSINGGGQFDRATAMNLDLSASYKPLNYLNLGANIQNVLGGKISWGNASEKLGGYTKLGAALNVLGQNTGEALIKHSQNISACFDLDLPRDVLGGTMLMHIGAEWSPFKVLSLRAGLNQETGGTGLTFGIGFINSAFRFDYAYAQRSGIAGDNPHYFSLSYIGDRTVKVSKKFKKAEAEINILSPKNRTITSLESITLRAKMMAKKTFSQTTTWTVPLLEVTSEVKDVSETVNLTNVLRNGIPINQTGTIESQIMLNPGRNMINFSGLVSPESVLLSAETRVLRITPFNDTPMDYWAIEPIALNSVLGLIKGYPDGSFKPEKGITRAELISLLVRTGFIDPQKWEKALAEERFTDAKGKSWFVPYVNIGVELGLATGYPDKAFKPNKVLTRAEGITLLARFAKLIEKDSVAFADLKPGFWANKYIQPAKDAGLLKYLEGKNFEFAKPFTRSEAAEVFYRTSPIQKKVDRFWETGITIEATATKEATTKVPASEFR